MLTFDVRNSIIYVINMWKHKCLSKFRFTDIMQYADGTQNVDLNNTSISGETNLEYYYRNVDGYTNKGDMYKELVESQKADYTEEITDGLK